MPIQAELKVLPVETATFGTVQEPLTLVTRGCGKRVFDEMEYPAQSKLTMFWVCKVLRKGVTTDDKIVKDAINKIIHIAIRKIALVFQFLW